METPRRFGGAFFFAIYIAVGPYPSLLEVDDMNARLAVPVLAALAWTIGCKPQVSVGSPKPAAFAILRNTAGTTIGTLDMAPTTGGVRITGNVLNLPAGTHGIHLHAVGRCEGPDFASAGGHFNPASAHHGLENPAGPHAGDLPNVVVGANGTVDVDVTDPRVTLDASSNGVFDADGTAIVIHAGADDQKSDPSGNSGARIACGIIQKP